MKNLNLLKILFSLLFISFFGSCFSAQDKDDSGSFKVKFEKVNKAKKIEFAAGLKYEYPVQFKSCLDTVLSKLTSGGPQVSGGSKIIIEKIVFKQLGKNEFKSKFEQHLPQKFGTPGNLEAYAFQVQGSALEVIYCVDISIFQAAYGLVRLKKQNDLFDGLYLDWPSIQKRYLHFVNKKTDVNDLTQLTNLALSGNYNGFIILVADGLLLNNPKYKSFGAEHAISEKMLSEWIALWKSYGLEVIPEVKLVSHQEKFITEQVVKAFQKGKNGENKILLNNFTYDPMNKPFLDTVIYPYLTEIQNLFKSKYFHIGHDEVKGVYYFGKEEQNIDQSTALKPFAYKQSILDLHKYFNENFPDVTLMMWGDMFLEYAKYPNMQKKKLTGPNKFPLLLPDIPKDIIICDWHYFDQGTEFPSFADIKKSGHVTYAAVWNNKSTGKNFINYVKENGGNSAGIITTLWHLPRTDGYAELYDFVPFTGLIAW
jgi:hypothetical protein